MDSIIWPRAFSPVSKAPNAPVFLERALRSDTKLRSIGQFHVRLGTGLLNFQLDSLRARPDRSLNVIQTTERVAGSAVFFGSCDGSNPSGTKPLRGGSRESQALEGCRFAA